jgi:AraC family transcriptional regulator
MSPEKRYMVSANEGVDPLQPIWDKSLQLNGIRVSDACYYPAHFPEHSQEPIKIAVPLEHSSIQVHWQTASGYQKRQWIQTGQVSIVPPHLSREIIWERESELVAIYLDPGLVARATEGFSGKTVEIVENWTASDPLIWQMGLALREELQRPAPERLYVESMANFLAVHLLKHYSTAQKSPGELKGGLPKHKLQQAIDYIHAYLDRDLSLAELAALVQMSPHHFARLFKQSTGFTPHQYVIRTRVERAKQLLKEGKLTIAQIAYSVGFAHQSHLNRHFKRWLGVTPKILLFQYQERATQSENVQDADSSDR